MKASCCVVPEQNNVSNNAHIFARRRVIVLPFACFFPCSVVCTVVFRRIIRAASRDDDNHNIIVHADVHIPACGIQMIINSLASAILGLEFVGWFVCSALMNAGFRYWFNKGDHHRI